MEILPERAQIGLIRVNPRICPGALREMISLLLKMLKWVEWPETMGPHHMAPWMNQASKYGMQRERDPSSDGPTSFRPGS